MSKREQAGLFKKDSHSTSKNCVKSDETHDPGHISARSNEREQSESSDDKNP